MNETLPWANSPYSIKRHGLTLTNCESEPVQTPGCIQAHGALLVLRLSDLTVLQASENTEPFLGEPPESLLGQPVERVVGQESAARLRMLLDQPSSERNAQYAFTHQGLDISAHQINGVGVLEFEAMADKEASPDYLVLVKSAVGRLQSASGLQEFCQRVAEEVRELTGQDRVMIYRFHADNHGEVFAESKRGELPPWLGLHYPEADIPKQAREIFKKIGIRPVPNAAGPLVELVPLANPETGKPLNMTHCALRGASVMYTEYLANMGVAASLTMPILCGGELWGLIACHHSTPTQFSYSLRSACEFLAQVASLQLKSAEQNEQLHYKLRVEAVHQQLVTKAAKDGDLMALTDLHPSLLDALDAGGVALHHLNRWWCVGATPSVEQLDSLADWLDTRPEFDSVTRPVFVTDSLVRTYPAGAELAEVASGLLAVLLSRRRRDLILWFRPETAQTVSWAGSPLDKPLTTGPNGPRLTPRRSFELFLESVQQRSLPWLPVEIDSALRLRILIMELVVSRSEQLNLLNKDLTQSNDELDAFAYVASHDLKEPLRGIHKYANQLLESAQTLDGENQQRVESLLRLTIRMDSLLSSLLHFSRVGRTALERESVELGEVVDEALEMIGARRSDFNLHVKVPRPLPPIDCDRVRVREIFSNLLSNAKKYTTQELPEVEIGYILLGETAPSKPVPAEAQNQMIFYIRDKGIGIEARHFEQIFRMFKRLHSPTEFGGGVGAGLTIVQRLVQRHGGHIWLDSTVGIGTTFYFTLDHSVEAP
ncbi:GAF domain-containing protein [Armatimonas sp.]|uniref:GAF domain-containing protein n=1 Tax=Armatimonas sp. TaxID=1872638 RepID=UPI00374CEF6B